MKHQTKEEKKLSILAEKKIGKICKQFFIMRKKTFFDNESLCLRKTGSGYRIFSATTFFDRKGLNAGSHQFSEKLRSI